MEVFKNDHQNNQRQFVVYLLDCTKIECSVIEESETSNIDVKKYDGSSEMSQYFDQLVSKLSLQINEFML